MDFLLLALLFLLPLLYYFFRPPSISTIPTATPHFPLVGNAISYGLNPIKFLQSQRSRHGDVVLVNLAVIKMVFLLGPDGNNAFFKGTERNGISFWAAISFIFGPVVEKGNVPFPFFLCSFDVDDKPGVAMKDWVEVSLKIIQKALNDPERLDCWMKGIRPIAEERFNMWAGSGEDVPLFKGMSNLVITLLLHIFTGAEFAGKHADETALQAPVTKILPRWMSSVGRFMNHTEARIKFLIDEEIDRRLENPEKYKNNMDYLQYVLDTVGGTYKEGTNPEDIF
jgi:hypothetical protein